MTQKDKDLLLKDLSGRLPYGVICNTSKGNGYLCCINQTIFGIQYGINIKATERDYLNDREEIIKPYLRSKTNMTKEERDKYNSYCDNYYDIYFDTIESIDYLNSIHVDYRGLIHKDLAIEVTKENNPYKG